jgi:hypothetical protein
MIKIENVVLPHEKQWEAIIRGMRNPLNSWDKSDSKECRDTFCGDCDGECLPHTNGFIIGSNDLDLMKRLDKAGTEHRKFMRMITVYVDITAPLYWWKEHDQYKVGTVTNSCSTMHKIAAKEFTLDDFSCEHLETISRFGEDGEEYKPYMLMKEMIKCLNACRKTFMKTKNKTDWWQLIQLLPNSYNQKRTVMLNYEVLASMYHQRKNHKLDEWRTFCEWIKTLPCSELITGEEHE